MSDPAKPVWTGSMCPQCGFDVPLDEDGCCSTCGADAHGPGVEAALQLRRDLSAVTAELDELRASLRRLAKYHFDTALDEAKALLERARPLGEEDGDDG